MKKTKHGGVRSGAGRSRIELDLQKRRNIMLSDKYTKKAKRISGNGNVSEGVRIALKAYK